MESDGILRAVLRLIRGVSGARMASLYLGMPPGSTSRPILIHDGAPPAVSELIDQPSAVVFAREGQADDGFPVSPAEWMRVRPVASATDHAYLVRIPALESLFAAAPEPEPAVERRSGPLGLIPAPPLSAGIGTS